MSNGQAPTFSELFQTAAYPTMDTPPTQILDASDPDDDQTNHIMKTLEFIDPEKTIPICPPPAKYTSYMQSCLSSLQAPKNRSMLLQKLLVLETNQISTSCYDRKLGVLEELMTGSTNCEEKSKIGHPGSLFKRPSAEQVQRHVEVSSFSENKQLEPLPKFKLESIVPAVINHEKEYLNLAQKVLKYTSVIYSELQSKGSAQLTPIEMQLTYLLFWIEIKFCKGVGALNSRKSNPNMFYSFLDLPKELLDYINMVFHQQALRDPMLLLFRNELSHDLLKISNNVVNQAGLVARNHPGSPQKVAVHLFAKKLDCLYSYRWSVLAGWHSDALFSLLNLMKSGILDSSLEQKLRKVVSCNYLMVLVEKLSPISWSSEEKQTQTQLVYLDWSAIHASADTDELFDAAVEDLSIQTSII